MRIFGIASLRVKASCAKVLLLVSVADRRIATVASMEKFQQIHMIQVTEVAAVMLFHRHHDLPKLFAVLETLEC
jgi:hypothetical protein